MHLRNHSERTCEQIMSNLESNNRAALYDSDSPDPPDDRPSLNFCHLQVILCWLMAKRQCLHWCVLTSHFPLSGGPGSTRNETFKGFHFVGMRFEFPCVTKSGVHNKAHQDFKSRSFLFSAPKPAEINRAQIRTTPCVRGLTFFSSTNNVCFVRTKEAARGGIGHEFGSLHNDNESN